MKFVTKQKKDGEFEVLNLTSIFWINLRVLTCALEFKNKNYYTWTGA